VCVPAGTRNHLARDLGLDVEDVAGSLDAFASDVEHRIDLGFVNGRVFVNNVSFGIYAQIVQSPEYRDAKLRTMERMLPELLGPSAQEFDLRFRGPNGGADRTAQLLLVSNNRYVLDRLDGMGSRPRIDGGELGIVAVQIVGSAAAAELMALQTVGQVRRFPGWEEWTAQSFEIRSSGPIAAGIDGEAVTLDPPLNLWVVPGALGVRLPPDALGLSRAALMPTGNALRDLGRIAATGRV
jgi:diacylglycerol kinase family enzyme